MVPTTAPLVGGAMKPTTDPLKQVIDRLVKEQQAALQIAETNKSRHDEMSTYVSRLEQYYQALVKNNSALRAKVASDGVLVQDLCSRVDSQNNALVLFEKQLSEISCELHLAETHREKLTKSRAEAEAVAKKLSEQLSETTLEAQELRTGLSEALTKCTNLESKLEVSEEKLAAQKISADKDAERLSSALEQAKVELSDTKCSFAEKEEALRSQLETATTNAADLSSQLEKKMALLQRLEDDLASVVALKNVVSKELDEMVTLAASLESSLEEVTKEAAVAAAKAAELEAQLVSEKQRYEQLTQQSDADRAASALAMEEAIKKFSFDLAEALKNSKSESEKELGAERERMSTEIARIQAEHTAKLGSLTTSLAAATKQSAADEKEKARLENLLDERNLLISDLEQKCSERAAEISKLQQNLNVAAQEALSTAEKAAKLQQELEETTEELEEKRVALESISAFAGKQNNISSAAPTAPAAAIKKRRAASSPPAQKPRMNHKARFNENPISRTLILEEEEDLHQQPDHPVYESEPQEDDAWGFDTNVHPDDDEDDEEVDEEALRTAIVIHTNTNNQGGAGGRPVRQARMRQSQVVVEEVDDSDEESYEVPPRGLHRNKAPAAKPVKTCIKPAAGGSRPAPKSRLAAMRPANSYRPSPHTANAARRGGKAGKVVSKNHLAGGGGFGGSQQHASQNHTLFNLFGGLGNASPGDS